MSHSILLERRFGFDVSTYPENITKRRVYILPTRNGLLFGIMLLIMLLGAINYDNNLAYLLTFLLSSLTLVAIFFTYRNIAGLILTLREPEPVFAGNSVLFPIQIDNHEQGHRYSLSLANQTKPKQWFFRANTLTKPEIVDINANQLELTHLPIPGHQRGKLYFNRLQVSTSFPLGLFKAWSNCDFDKYCIIYPAPEGNLPVPKTSINSQDGCSNNKDGNDDFIGVRHYRLGDSSRQIDWKAYARERGLHRKLFQGNGNSELIFHWHDVAILNDTESKLSQLCSWILEADNQSQLYGLNVGKINIEPGRGSYHRQRCLTALALHGLSP